MILIQVMDLYYTNWYRTTCKRTSVFNASTPVGELLNVVAGKVNDMGDLPSQCKHGMVVEVVNSVADETIILLNFLVIMIKMVGTWEECAKPGRAVKFNETTMPVILIRTADGNFRLTEQKIGNYTIAGKSFQFHNGTTL